MKVVGVHGVGNYRAGADPGAALTEVWRRHLGRGLGKRVDDIDLNVAYYADCLRPPGKQGPDVGLDDLEPDAEKMVRDWLSELKVPAGLAQGPGTWPIRQGIAWVAERRRLSPKFVELFIATFFREVAMYLRAPDEPMRARARNRVADAIDGAQIVIAHSLGSVVAYEALCERAPEVNLFVTLGSPLAIPHAVFPRLTPPGERPPGVRRWVNIADPGDLVALPPKGLSRRFPVDVDDHSVIHAFDFHLVANYLACARLCEELSGRRAT